MITTFLLDPAQGEVSRRTAYVRNNGPLNGDPTFTILSNRCVHLGCPVQVNGLPLDDAAQGGSTTPRCAASPRRPRSGSGAHATEASTTPRATAPPARPCALDRYEFKIKNGRLVLSKTYSVSYVEGTGAEAEIHKYDLMGPGQHVDGLEAPLYPIRRRGGR